MRIEIVQTSDLAACHALRRAVFIDEQGIAEPEEWDELDGVALHLLARADGRPTGTARLVLEGETGRIGRICVLKGHRGTGIGRQLVARAIELARENGMAHATLGAQLHALDFYRALGFAAHGPVYDDAGIPHREMSRDL